MGRDTVHHSVKTGKTIQQQKKIDGYNHFYLNIEFLNKVV